ncbi:hypothetical protein Hanom_Chr17g01533541 [Helianthus anomalus]
MCKYTMAKADRMQIAVAVDISCIAVTFADTAKNGCMRMFGNAHALSRSHQAPTSTMLETY